LNSEWQQNILIHGSLNLKKLISIHTGVIYLHRVIQVISLKKYTTMNTEGLAHTFFVLCYWIFFIYQALTLTFVRLSCTSENWRRTSRSCITVVRRDKLKNDRPTCTFWMLFSIIKMCCFVIFRLKLRK
jgi:hypothetical protein